MIVNCGALSLATDMEIVPTDNPVVLTELPKRAQVWSEPDAKGKRVLSPHIKALAKKIARGEPQEVAYMSVYGRMPAKGELSDINHNAMFAEYRRQQQDIVDGRLMWSRGKSVKALINIHDESDNGTVKIAAVRELNLMHGYNEPLKVALQVQHIPTSIDELL